MSSYSSSNTAHLPSPKWLNGYLRQCHARLQEVLAGSFSMKKLRISHTTLNFDIEKTDAMRGFFKVQKQLWQEGKPVWGFIISVQEILWQSDKDCGFGLLLHPLDPDSAIHPDGLTYAAQLLWQALENPEDFPECDELIAQIQRGKTRIFGQPVPASLSPSCQLALTHICVDKIKLYQQPFDVHPFPALFMPDPPAAVLMPFWTWPKELFNAWQELS